MTFRAFYNKTSSFSKTTAFSLAEVLITLGIIGAVAAITIPNLIIQVTKDDTLSKLRKTYSSLSQAVKLSEANNGNNGSWDWGNEGLLTVQESFDKYWTPYLKILHFCNTTAECGYPASNKFNAPDGTPGMTTIINPLTRPSCILSDGTFLMVLPVDGSGSVIKSIYVDLNAGAPPNRFGRDVFMMKLDTAKGLVPYGFNSSSVDADCSFSGGGFPCLQKIIMDGWQISDNYPW